MAQFDSLHPILHLLDFPSRMVQRKSTPALQHHMQLQVDFNIVYGFPPPLQEFQKLKRELMSIQRRQAKAGTAAATEVDAALHGAADVSSKLAERESAHSKLVVVLEGVQEEKKTLALEAAGLRKKVDELQRLADASHCSADEVQQKVSGRRGAEGWRRRGAG